MPKLTYIIQYRSAKNATRTVYAEFLTRYEPDTRKSFVCGNMTSGFHRGIYVGGGKQVALVACPY